MKTVLLLSGGMDSSTLLYYLKAQGHEVHALTLNYNQRHIKEIESAKKICQLTETEHTIIDISAINQLISKSSLTSSLPVPHGHYEDESMKDTVVPNRNMILLSLAIGFAVNLGYDSVSYAVHSGDHAIYPDCRPEFFDKMNLVSHIANYEPISIFAPFLRISKIDIAKLGKHLKVPFHETWTCYEGGDEPCGKCGSCIERQEALDSII